MRAIFGALSLLTICSAETLSWDKNDDVGKQEKFSKNRFLVATHHADNAPSPVHHWDNVSSSTVASIPNASTPKTIASNYFSKVLSKKRRKSLKKERSKLRSTLKKIKHDKAARSTVLKRIREINDEIKNHQNEFKSHRKTNKKKLAQKHPSDKNTTPRNKDIVFKWSLKNNSSSSKVINKPNHQQNSKSDHSNTFKVRREGVINKNNIGSSNISDSTENEVTTPTHDEIVNYKAMSIVRAPNSPTIDLQQIESDNYVDSNVDNMTTAKESNGFSKINYAKLLQIQSTTVPPIKNISLNVILREFNAISDQIGEMFPGAKTYPKFEVSKAPVRKIATRCSVMKGGCEHICHPKGPKKCSCLSGFKLSPNKRSCIDIDECHHKNGGCSQTCNNTPGSHYCGCLPGLRLSENKRSCEDINECLLRNGHGPCQDTCENTHGSYKCSCTGLNGTHLGKDKHSCEDVNECLDGQSGCSHGCVNTLGRAYCTCPDGMELGADWKTCNDINECESKEIQKLCSNGCLNTVGSFRCVENYELQNDQTAFPVPDEIACPPLFPPKHGFLDCSRKKGLSVKMKSKSGRRRVTNRPGTFCKLVCPSGYRNVGVFKTTCGFDGEWIGDNWGKCEHFPPPSLKCPESQTVHLKKDEESVLVTFNAPKSNVDWEHVTADPEWAKSLKGYLHQGYHWLTFSVTDPRTELNATCSFVVNIKKHTF